MADGTTVNVEARMVCWHFETTDIASAAGIAEAETRCRLGWTVRIRVEADIAEVGDSKSRVGLSTLLMKHRLARHIAGLDSHTDCVIAQVAREPASLHSVGPQRVSGVVWMWARAELRQRDCGRWRGSRGGSSLQTQHMRHNMRLLTFALRVSSCDSSLQSAVCVCVYLAS